MFTSNTVSQLVQIGSVEGHNIEPVPFNPSFKDSGAMQIICAAF